MNHTEADEFGFDEDLDGASTTVSLTSTACNYREKNNRTYAMFGGGEYMLPNDEKEKDRLVDLTHHIWKLLKPDKLYHNPGKKWKEILDVGTGTGIWAIEVAHEHPEAAVVGVDISPMQPKWVPVNCKFEIDDMTQEWLHNCQFDLVFIRAMNISFRVEDWPRVLKEAFRKMEPGGYIEIQDVLFPLTCDEKKAKETRIYEWSEHMVEAANKIGRSLTVASKFKSMLETAGFVDIEEIRYEIPIGPWQEDPALRDLGEWCRKMLENGIEGISIELFTTQLRWSIEETFLFLASVRNDMKDETIHVYWDTYIVYARKPEDSAT